MNKSPRLLGLVILLYLLSPGSASALNDTPESNVGIASVYRSRFPGHKRLMITRPPAAVPGAPRSG